MGSDWVQSNSAEDDLGTLFDDKLDISQLLVLQAKKASYMLGCISKSVGSQQGEVGDYSPLFSVPETMCAVLGPSWGSTAQKSQTCMCVVVNYL